MKKKIVKIIFVLLIILNIFITISNAGMLSDVFTKGKGFIKAGTGSNKMDTDKIYSLSQSISSVLQIVSVAAALIMIGILGIQYMVGSVEEQAKIKETMTPFIIGCLIAFGASTIWKTVVNILNGLNV